MSVTAPPEVQARLLELNEFDVELARIATRRRQAEAARELAEAAAVEKRIRRSVADLRGSRDDVRRELRRIESDVEVVEQRLTRDRSRLQSTTSAKDAQSFEQEIASLIRRRGVLEDTELEVMERAEAAEQATSTAEAELAVAEATLATLKGRRDDTLAALRASEKAIAADRTALVDELPADLVALYERQRTRYGVGAALLTRGVSGGSNMALTGADLATIRAAAPDAVVLDPESGCILVRTDESGL